PTGSTLSPVVLGWTPPTAKARTLGAELEGLKEVFESPIARISLPPAGWVVTAHGTRAVGAPSASTSSVPLPRGAVPGRALATIATFALLPGAIRTRAGCAPKSTAGAAVPSATSANRTEAGAPPRLCTVTTCTLRHF